MEDKRYDGTFAMRRVEVAFHDFARRVHGEGSVMAALVRGIRNDVKRRLAGGDRDERLTVIDQQLPAEGEHGLGLIDELGALLNR